MDGGVVGDAIQPKNLVESEPQQILQARLLGAALGLARDEPIESFLPADDAEDKFLREATISGRKPRWYECMFEQSLRVIVTKTSLAEDARRNFSWFLAVHFV